MTLIFAQNNPKSLISILLDFLIVGSCIFIYLSYTIITNSNVYEEPIYDIQMIHSHLDIGVFNTEFKCLRRTKIVNSQKYS